MKKLIAIILILAMILPEAALAEERDPIVGCWYMYYNSEDTPEFSSSFPGVKSEISIYEFQASGTIMLLDNTIKDYGTGTPTYTACGKWSKTGNEYSFSIIGSGSGKLSLVNGEMFLESSGVYVKFHKLYAWDPYSDIITK